MQWASLATRDAHPDTTFDTMAQSMLFESVWAKLEHTSPHSLTLVTTENAYTRKPSPRVGGWGASSGYKFWDNGGLGYWRGTQLVHKEPMTPSPITPWRVWKGVSFAKRARSLHTASLKSNGIHHKRADDVGTAVASAVQDSGQGQLLGVAAENEPLPHEGQLCV